MDTSLAVTGGLGFIGSAFVRRSVRADRSIINLDAHTYAADARRLEDSSGSVTTIPVDIGDSAAVREAIRNSEARVLVHFAAETHVTRSETSEAEFFRTNLDGTRNVLDAAAEASMDLVVHVSTDEVYGPALEHPFKESDKPPGEGLATSPYARSKALADDLATEYGTRFPVVIVRPTNCYGPWQHPEKAIPRWTTRALSGDRLPVWGDGGYVRDWMFVDDACAAIELLVDTVTESDIYNIGPEMEPITNLRIATTIAARAGIPAEHVYLTEYDRPDHDRRYSVDSGKMRALGWKPEVDIEAGIESTVDWYRRNREWWRPLVSSAEALYQDADERS